MGCGGNLVATLGLNPFIPQCGTRHAGRNWRNPSASRWAASPLHSRGLTIPSCKLGSSAVEVGGDPRLDLGSSSLPHVSKTLRPVEGQATRRPPLPLSKALLVSK